MAEPSLESTMDLATRVSKIGFVEFTTDLVKNVYNVIVQASMDQLKSYADLVKEVSGTLIEYQKSIGLEGTPDSPSNELKVNCEKYAIEVLGLTLIPATTSTNKTYNYEASDLNGAIEKRNAIISEFKGLDFDSSTTGADPIGTIEQVNLMPIPTDKTLSITSDLDKIIALKLKRASEDNYNLLVTILKLGMQKIVVDKGLIATKLTFHVDATQTASKASSDMDTKSKNFNLGGGIKGFTPGIMGRVGGGYSSTNLSVSVVNEKSSAVANMSADIVGEVRIEFRTDSFPTIDK